MFAFDRKPASSSARVRPALAPERPAKVPLQRKCTACEDDEERSLQRKAAAENQSQTPSPARDAADPGRLVQSVLQSGSGSPLDTDVRAYFEPRLGQDLSGVRVHTGHAASASARAVSAVAYTVGQDIVFRDNAYHPRSKLGSHLLAHELVHVAQQGKARAGTAAPQRTREPFSISSPGDAAEREAEVLADALIEGRSFPGVREQPVRIARQHLTPAPAAGVFPPSPFGLPPPIATSPPANDRGNGRDELKSVWEAGIQVSKLGIVQGDSGAQLFASPDKASRLTANLAINTRLFVNRETPGGWYFVVLENGQYGYVAKALINVEAPDAAAQLYRIQSGESALALVQKFYKKDATQWGQDERFFVNVLVLVNSERGRKGIYKDSPDDSWDATKTKAGSQIWIPGVDFAKTLKGKVSSGSLSYEVYQNLKNAAVAVGEFLLGTGAFVAGLLHGALESVWDTLVGLVELVELAWKIIKSIFTLSLISDIQGLISDISKISLSDLVDAGLQWLDKKWNNPDLLSRWHFRGWIIGYAIAEILMLFFSGGILTAVKSSAKAGKIGQLLAKFPRVAKVVEKVKTGVKDIEGLEKLQAGIKALKAARDWAAAVLKIPATILQDLTVEAIERLKKLPAWAKERFAELSDLAKGRILGCASPCKVNIEAIQKYLAELAAKGAAGAKKLTSVDEVLAALPKDLHVGKIKEYLTDYPALMETIRKAGLTDKDFGKLADFLTGADKANPKTAYQTFTRYLTNVVPSKVGPDIKTFNEILEAVVKADPRQGAALKGPMFEAFLRVHVQEFAGKPFTRASFKGADKTRTVDRFVEDLGEIWEFKHQILEKVPEGQLSDYLGLIGQKSASGKTVKSIQYVFPTEEAAKLNAHLKRFDIRVYFLKPPNILTPL